MLRSRILSAAAVFGVVAGVVPVLAPSVSAFSDPTATVFVSEFHYDNTGADAGEAIEVTGPAGTDLTGWSLVLYNGNGGAPYDTIGLSGSIDDEGAGLGAVSFATPGLQNGAPDGFALVDPADTIVQFLSYEGTFAAIGGPADGLTSTDVGVSEDPTPTIGTSLQLAGTGSTAGDFTWTASAAETFGDLNITPGTVAPNPPYISEFHYDNAGADAGEFVEVTGPAGTDLTGWSLVLYNGNGGAPYDTIGLSGSIDDEGAGLGAVSFATPGLQNGAPDGFALVDPADTIVQFLSYEGGFTATDGPAAGLTSADVGVSEAGDTPIGQSLQLIDGAWTGPTAESPGTVNAATSSGNAVISEIHYDNAGGDVGESVEVEGDAGLDLAGWSLVLYNGNGGAPYNTIMLSGVIDDEASARGAVSFDTVGIQNGSPDAVALVDATDTVIDFVSYEGSIVGVGGPADGLTAPDIGVSEAGDTPIGQSLQLIDGAWTGPATASFGSLNSATPPPPPPPTCPAPPAVTKIHEIQGTGDVTPCAGEDIVVEAVVVADYEGPSPNLRGFYLQEEDADADADATTSEGLFVFNFDNDDVDLGDLVRVAGTAGEFQDQTQISNVTDITVLGTGSVSPASVTLPLAATDALEAVEGMAVSLDQTLYATEFFQLGRFGQVVVSSGDRLDQPTAVAAPGAAANAVQAANDLNRLIIDDTTNDQNPEPIIYGGNGAPLTAANPLRGGDTLTGATGVMTYGWAGNRASGNAFRVRPADAPIEFASANPRPTEVADVGGDLTVASFNVLNYFLTLDEGSNVCGPVGSESGCRGADDAEEFERQRAKLLAALVEIQADVVGLVELENTTGVEPLADIVEGLNAILGDDTYDYVETGTIGTDVIKVGVIYRTDAVAPAGVPAVLDSSVDPRFRDDRNRPALATTFIDLSNGELLTVVTNHFKSKGCGSSTGLDTDQSDGQGCFNPARTSAAEALVDWLTTDPTGVPTDGTLIIGDLNAYAQEDPLTVLADAGYVDLAAAFDDDPYSYVFDGQWGYLDYALASPELFARVTGATEYHINADEPNVLDYNTNFQSPTQIQDLYAPDQYRTSDHDPVIVGIDTVGTEELPLVSISDATAIEGDEMIFEVTLDRPSHLQIDVSVGTKTKGKAGWAKSGDDFVRTRDSFVFESGQTTTQFVVPTIADDLVEGDEQLQAQILGVENVDKGDRVGDGLIIDAAT